MNATSVSCLLVDDQQAPPKNKLATSKPRAYVGKLLVGVRPKMMVEPSGDPSSSTSSQTASSSPLHPPSSVDAPAPAAAAAPPPAPVPGAVVAAVMDATSILKSPEADGRHLQEQPSEADFVHSMTFANQHRETWGEDAVLNDDFGTCECDECQWIAGGRGRKQRRATAEIPDAIATAIANYKRQRPLPLQQSRALVKRFNRVSVWEWTLPWHAPPMVEFGGGSHRFVHVQRLRSHHSVLQRMGKGIAGSGAEEDGRVTLCDWTEGRVAWVPANGGEAIGYVHSSAKTTISASGATEPTTNTNTSSSESSTRGDRFATLIVAKIPCDLLDDTEASSAMNLSHTDEASSIQPPQWYELLCKAAQSQLQTARTGDAADVAPELVIGTEDAESLFHAYQYGALSLAIYLYYPLYTVYPVMEISTHSYGRKTKQGSHSSAFDLPNEANMRRICLVSYAVWASCHVVVAFHISLLSPPSLHEQKILPYLPRTKLHVADPSSTTGVSTDAAGPSTNSSWSNGTHDSGSKKTPMERSLEFELLSSVARVPSEAWDACLNSHSSPFLEHSWLRCLEESKCASPSTGWVPQHVCIRIDGTIKGFVPLYIKGHSLGEFIFDQQFAEAAYQNGIDYYPKLLVGVPFTPATGQRILWHPTVYATYNRQELRQLRRAVGLFLRKIAESNNLSSVHWNFLTDDEATDLSGPLQLETDRSTDVQSKLRSLLSKLSTKNDYLRRTSLQYHWINENPKTGRPFADFDEYLSCFKSKRRITVKRERTKVLHEDDAIRVDAVCGRDILKYDGLVERMFEIYLSTIDKMVWGRQYLTLEFFQLLVRSDFIDNLCFMCSRRRDAGDEIRADDVFAGTFNVIKDGVFYGRYWGCLPGRQVKNLHFEVCYWSAIDYCIENGLSRMEPGAGGGDYKWTRGFDPSLIHSVHYICHPDLRRAVAQFLDYETENNVEVTEYLRQRSVVASK